MSAAARAVTLVRRPKAGEALTTAMFDVQRGDDAAPESLPANSIEVALRWLSVDPYLRCRFNEDTGVDYTVPYAVGEPLSSAGVGVVQRSSFADAAVAAKYQPGTIVQSLDIPWRARQVFTMPESTDNAPALGGFPEPLPASLAAQGVDAAAPAVLSALGVTGLTAYFAVEEAFDGATVSSLLPPDAAAPAADRSFDRAVVVSSVAGATGSVFASICRRIPGVKVIGLTSTAEKVARVTNEGICDVAIAYRDFASDEDAAATGSLRAAVEEAAGGLPVLAYLDSVGGWISTHVFNALAPQGRVVLCGQISTYDDDVPYPPPLSTASQAALEQRQLRRDRYLVLKYQARFGEAQAHIGQLVATGAVPLLTTVHHGLESAPEAMVGVMAGRNVGKMLVRCSD